MIGYSRLYSSQNDAQVSMDNQRENVADLIVTNEVGTIYTLASGRRNLRVYQLGNRYLARSFQQNGRRDSAFFNCIDSAIEQIIDWYIDQL